MLENPSKVDDIADEIKGTPLAKLCEGSLKLHLDQLSFAEDDVLPWHPVGLTEAEEQQVWDLKTQINAEIKKRIDARAEALTGEKPNAVPFADDVAQDRYAANTRN